MDLDTKVYLSRVALGFVGGFISGFLKMSIPQFGLVIFSMGLVYIASVFLFYRVYVSKGRYEIKPIFLEGIGSYVLVWLFIWSILYNILVIYS